MERRGEMPFVTSGESPIVPLIDQMNAALKEAGIERSSFEKYTVYSLRAVNALRNGVGVFEVARKMGTSGQMIQEYYGKQATSAVVRNKAGRLILAQSVDLRKDATRSKNLTVGVPNAGADPNG